MRISVCLQLKIDGDFLYFLADAAVIAVSMHVFYFSTSVENPFFQFQVIIISAVLQFQYGNPDKLCSPLIGAKNAGKDLVVSPCSC